MVVTVEEEEETTGTRRTATRMSRSLISDLREGWRRDDPLIVQLLMTFTII